MSKHLVLMCTSEVNGVPDKIKILPFGDVKSQKGNFIVDDESFKLIKNHFKNRGLDLVIDYEHQTLENTQAPAGGWIKDIEKEGDAIVAKVEWTPKAKDYLQNKEYRYLSPVVLVRKKDNKAVVLHSVALTNTPAIDNMYPIVNSINLNEYEDDEGGEKTMDLKELAKQLRLPEDATEEQIKEVLAKIVEAAEKIKADGEGKKDPEGQPGGKVEGDNAADPNKDKKETEVVANKTILGALGLSSNAKTEDVAAVIMSLKNSVNDVNELKEKLKKDESKALVMKALKEGKITTAQQEWAEEYALKDADGFKAFTEKAARVVPVDKVNYGKDKEKTDFTDDTTMQALKQLGVSAEDVKKYGEVECKW